jgi:hypothetical protein
MDYHVEHSLVMHYMWNHNCYSTVVEYRQNCFLCHRTLHYGIVPNSVKNVNDGDFSASIVGIATDVLCFRKFLLLTHELLKLQK